MNAIQKVEPINNIMDVTDNIQRTKELAKKLMETKHYQKIGEEGIFAICMTAQANNISQLDALNGELYYVQGRVGMSAEAMNKYIRLQGHSISLKSWNDNECILVGKRKDTGDIAEVRFSMEDAKSAGKSYDKNRKDMLFARCISRLKRVLFPDVLCKIYEKGEVDDMAKEDKKLEDELLEKQRKEIDVKPLDIDPILESTLSTEQTIELSSILNDCDPKVKEKLLTEWIPATYKVDLLDEVPASRYDHLKKQFTKKANEYQKKLVEIEMADVVKVEEK